MKKSESWFYVSGHPLDEYKDKIEKINYTLSSQIDEIADGSQILIVGKIETISEKISKKVLNLELYQFWIFMELLNLCCLKIN